jgi:hypothetical protein
MKQKELDAYLWISGEKVTGMKVDRREFPQTVELKCYLKGLSSEWIVEPPNPSDVCTNNRTTTGSEQDTNDMNVSCINFRLYCAHYEIYILDNWTILGINVKSSLCFNWAPRREAYWGVEV